VRRASKRVREHGHDVRFLSLRCAKLRNDGRGWVMRQLMGADHRQVRLHWCKRIIYGKVLFGRAGTTVTVCPRKWGRLVHHRVDLHK
jgi:hypothetical protein